MNPLSFSPQANYQTGTSAEPKAIDAKSKVKRNGPIEGRELFGKRRRLEEINVNNNSNYSEGVPKYYLKKFTNLATQPPEVRLPIIIKHYNLYARIQNIKIDKDWMNTPKEDCIRIEDPVLRALTIFFQQSMEELNSSRQNQNGS